MNTEVSISVSVPDKAIERLAQLDSAPCPARPVLVAAVGGVPRAAVPLDGGRAIADPFHRTADLVSLLELRAAQMRGGRRRRRLARQVGGPAPAARPL